MPSIQIEIQIVQDINIAEMLTHPHLFTANNHDFDLRPQLPAVFAFARTCSFQHEILKKCIYNKNRKVDK